MEIINNSMQQLKLNYFLSLEWYIWLGHGSPVSISSFGLPLLLFDSKDLQISLCFTQLSLVLEMVLSVSRT